MDRSRTEKRNLYESALVKSGIGGCKREETVKERDSLSSQLYLELGQDVIVLRTTAGSRERSIYYAGSDHHSGHGGGRSGGTGDDGGGREGGDGGEHRFSLHGSGYARREDLARQKDQDRWMVVCRATSDIKQRRLTREVVADGRRANITPPRKSHLHVL